MWCVHLTQYISRWMQVRKNLDSQVSTFHTLKGNISYMEVDSVLKYRFNYYPGILGPIDEEKTVIEKTVLLLTGPKRRGQARLCRAAQGRSKGEVSDLWLLC